MRDFITDSHLILKKFVLTPVLGVLFACVEERGGGGSYSAWHPSLRDTAVRNIPWANGTSAKYPGIYPKHYGGGGDMGTSQKSVSEYPAKVNKCSE